MVDPKRFTPKKKLVIYIEAFIKLYNSKNNSQVYEIHAIVELEKMWTMTIKILCNLNTY